MVTVYPYKSRRQSLRFCITIHAIRQLVDKIDYFGKVYVYSSGMPAEIIKDSKEKLKEYGVNEDDIIIIEVPQGVPEGSIMVTIWPHYLAVARVKRVRDGSIYAPQLFNIEL